MASVEMVYHLRGLLRKRERRAKREVVPSRATIVGPVATVAEIAAGTGDVVPGVVIDTVGVIGAGVGKGAGAGAGIGTGGVGGGMLMPWFWLMLMFTRPFAPRKH